MSRNLTFKVSLKGAVSVYGLGRFPTTLYAEQWAALMSTGSGLAQFLAANAPKLAEQQERYIAAQVVAQRKGIADKDQDEFIKKLLGYESKGTSNRVIPTAKSSLVDELMAKAV